MLTISDVHASLQRIGFRDIERKGENLRLSTNLLDIVAKASASGIRFECQMLHSISRNKIFLWNIIHHNNSFFPFGSFSITPENKISFGWLLPAGDYFENWLDLMLFETISTAEGYYKMVQGEFNELPFEEEELTMNILDLIRTDLKAPNGLKQDYDRKQASIALERILEETFGFKNMVRLSEFEFGTTGDHIINLSLEKTPFFRKNENTPAWYIGIRTEVGMLSNTDIKLFIQLNRMNYNGFLVTHGMHYKERKPVVCLTSQLLPGYIQHPGLIKLVIERHNEQANFLLKELDKPYRIQNMLDYSLGV